MVKIMICRCCIVADVKRKSNNVVKCSMQGMQNNHKNYPSTNDIPHLNADGFRKSKRRVHNNNNNKQLKQQTRRQKRGSARTAFDQNTDQLPNREVILLRNMKLARAVRNWLHKKHV